MTPLWWQLRTQASRLRHAGDLPGALKRFKQAYFFARTDAPAEVPLLCNIIADLQVKSGALEEAEIFARESVRKQQHLAYGRKEIERLATYYTMLTRILEGQGRYREALENIEIAVPIFTGIYGSDYHFVKRQAAWMKRLEERAREQS